MDNRHIEELIEAVRLYPCLYKKENSPTPTEHKNLIWKEIAERIDYPVEKCKAKWRNLRDSHLKAIKWKHELEALGKLDSYHSYRHEEKLSFLSPSRKRRNDSRSDSRSKRAKEESSKEIFHETYEETSEEHYTEYQVLDSDRIANAANDEEEILFNAALTEDDTLSDNVLKINEGCLDEQQVQFIVSETASNHEEVPYQESYVQEHNPLDAWATDIKETLLSFPKLLRAKVRKQINELVSEYEIKYLESLGNARVGGSS